MYIVAISTVQPTGYVHTQPLLNAASISLSVHVKTKTNDLRFINREEKYTTLRIYSMFSCANDREDIIKSKPNRPKQ